ncbi:DUF2087 domain-containing protein [Pseudodesulfovibrio sp.]|uniref:DUF2087 domain-containing protein n=1 Tax=unclassified Pseudodesulfovibrio TaxID=2661612 RepID=UPI003B00983E
MTCLLLRWSRKHSVRLLALWVIWLHLPARSPRTEPLINELLSARHGFGDHALLRRWLVDHSMVERTAHGRRYLRCEIHPPADAEELIRRCRLVGYPNNPTQ